MGGGPRARDAPTHSSVVMPKVYRPSSPSRRSRRPFSCRKIAENVFDLITPESSCCESLDEEDHDEVTTTPRSSEEGDFMPFPRQPRLRFTLPPPSQPRPKSPAEIVLPILMNGTHFIELFSAAGLSIADFAALFSVNHE